ncbi:Scr1 family TA system antitoxin-like transcriptional regulator [Streptomyces sp. SP18BB07]|uniref:Scr1 family TA system antitoxin-like transcriptional regulator n=1 Tax=Streptomyces sp. SP18BB07 TaxID=3002522 RepID=UPI002E75E621|nr:Scr1 family TA system antitoxin-like transcriptional regulator [Streptomyces sp. SP18BB07]MEE1765832.1 Scr1 family TA system antitoxin-like transcriptional regulator [Streptomyces sp. SP18BB07]
MPPRSTPTARQERLGAELRKIRERAGVTARAAAALLGTNPIQQSAYEAGRSGISEERIRRLAAHCACDDVAYVDALVSMANERGKGWWEAYRGTVVEQGLALAESEYHATRIRTFQVVHIPGLLQTEEHMRALFNYASRNVPPSHVDTFVAYRTQRQQVLDEPSGTPYEAIVHEAALRIRVGGREATRAQLKRLLERSDAANVTVRVLPFDTDDFAGTGYSMLYLHGPVPQLDTVQIDTGHDSEFFDAEARLLQYRRRYERVAAAALPVAESRDLIARVAHEL